MRKRLTLEIAALTAWTVAVLLTPAVGRAQPPSMVRLTPAHRDGDTNLPSPIQAQIEISQTAAGKAEFLGTKSGDSDAFNASVSLFAPMPLSEKWVVPLGLRLQNIHLDSVPGMPVPDKISTLDFNIGLEHRPNGEWVIMGMLNPTLYKFNDVGGNDIGLSGGINARWRCSPSLTFTFGLVVAPDSDLAVVPMIGADWCINKEWNLRLMFPQPRLIYRPASHWNFYVGANTVGATFRSSDTLGSSIGRTDYNEARATYRDIRVGAGFGYSVGKSMRVELEGGYSVSRQIDFKDLETVKFEPTPYVRLGLNIGF